MATPQQLAETMMMMDIAQGKMRDNPARTQQNRVRVAYRQANKQVDNNFPIKF